EKVVAEADAPEAKATEAPAAKAKAPAKPRSRAKAPVAEAEAVAEETAEAPKAKAKAPRKKAAAKDVAQDVTSTTEAGGTDDGPPRSGWWQRTFG
ncbi:MAG: ribonuclease E/G, partial [Sphingorhabdus sp.]|nr:ribonuclease E/G [Sphingorhabdus sp.]